jgi:hypothetical protein
MRQVCTSADATLARLPTNRDASPAIRCELPADFRPFVPRAQQPARGSIAERRWRGHNPA